MKRIIGIIVGCIVWSTSSADALNIKPWHETNSCIGKSFTGFVFEYDGGNFRVFRETINCNMQRNNACDSFLYEKGDEMDEFLSTIEGREYFVFDIPKERVKDIEFNNHYSETCIDEGVNMPAGGKHLFPEALSDTRSLYKIGGGVMSVGRSYADTAEKLGLLLEEGALDGFGQAAMEPVDVRARTTLSEASSSIKVVDFKWMDGSDAAVMSVSEAAVGKRVLLDLGSFRQVGAVDANQIFAAGTITSIVDSTNSYINVEKLWSQGSSIVGNDSFIDLNDIIAGSDVYSTVTASVGVSSTEENVLWDITLANLNRPVFFETSSMTTNLFSMPCEDNGKSDWTISKEPALINSPIELLNISVTNNHRTVKLKSHNQSKIECNTNWLTSYPVQLVRIVSD